MVKIDLYVYKRGIYGKNTIEGKRNEKQFSEKGTVI